MDEGDAKAGKRRQGLRKPLPDAPRKVIEQTKEKLDKTQEKAKEVIERSKERLGETQERAKEVLEKSKERIGGVQEKAKEVLEESGERTKEVLEKSKERIGGVQEKAKEVLEESGERTKEALEHSKERLEETQGKAKEALKRSRERTRVAVDKSRAQTRKAVQKSRAKTRAVIDRSKKATRKAYDTGKEDITTGAKIIGHDVGYKAFREDSKSYIVRVAKLAGPVVFLTGWLLMLAFVPSITGGFELASYSLGYLLPLPVGKETWIFWAAKSGASPWATALSFTFVDLTLATFIVFNFDYIMRVPNLGRLTGRLVAKSREILSTRQWICQFAMFGLFFFVMIPMQGAGGAMGAIVGRVMGLKRWQIITPIVAGAAFESFILAFVSNTFFSFLPEWLTKWAGNLITVVIVAIVTGYLVNWFIRTIWIGEEKASS